MGAKVRIGHRHYHVGVHTCNVQGPAADIPGLEWLLFFLLTAELEISQSALVQRIVVAKEGQVHFDVARLPWLACVELLSQTVSSAVPLSHP